jgi:drug/metabolite transporter (DMT)-like permease
MRTSIMALGSYAYAKYIGGESPFSIRDKRLVWLLFLRGIMGCVTYTLEVMSVFFLPVSLAAVLISTQPIFASLMSYFVMGEKISKFELVSIIFSSFGVIMISKPRLFLHYFGINGTTKSYEQIEKDEIDYPYFDFGVVAALLAAICSGYCFILMRKIGTDVHFA